MDILSREFNRLGKEQFDPGAGKPIHKDLKEAMLEAKKKKGGR